MSTRQLRRVQAQKEAEKQTSAASQSESDEDDAVQTHRPNLFAALGGGADDEDDDTRDQELDEEEGSAARPAPEGGNSGSERKSTRKNKKKKKKTKKKTAGPTAAANDDVDEIDKAIEELNITVSQPRAEPHATKGSRLNDLLSINTHRLRPVNEMRQLFGRETIEAADAEESQQARSDGRRQPALGGVGLGTYLREPPGAKKLPEISLRRNVFVQGRDHWPCQPSGGLTMREVRKRQGGNEYAFFYEQEYDEMQQTFWECVKMGEPMNMVHLLKEMPYNVSLSLQVGNIAKHDRDMALAAELYERALFTFGRVTTSAFRQDLERGQARLDFRRPENRQFWLAGYYNLGSLLRKGTFRTALEWAKLLFAMDLGDPFGMRHFIHPLAIRCHAAGWLSDFLEELEKLGVYSDLVYISQTSILAKLQNGEVEEAREALIKGLKTVPWLYCSLFQELNLDTPPAIWGLSADSSDTRKFWTGLYIAQTKDLWKNRQARDLLVEVTKSQDRIDIKHLPEDDAEIDLASGRLVYLEGLKSLITLLPPDMHDAQPNYDFDPMPPVREQNIFTSEAGTLPWIRMPETEAEEVGAIMDQLRDFFTSGQEADANGRASDILPFIMPDQQMLDAAAASNAAAAAADEDEDEEIAYARRVLREDSGLLMEGMSGLGGGGQYANVLRTLRRMFGLTQNTADGGEGGSGANGGDGNEANGGDGNEANGGDGNEANGGDGNQANDGGAPPTEP